MTVTCDREYILTLSDEDRVSLLDTPLPSHVLVKVVNVHRCNIKVALVEFFNVRVWVSTEQLSISYGELFEEGV